MNNIRQFIFILMLAVPAVLTSQTIESTKSSSQNVQDSTVASRLAALSEKGIEVLNDSILVSDEVQKIINDSVYRDTIYPDIYTWNQTMDFIKKVELKKAFWFLINLYPESEKNKEIALKTIITYDKLYKMDKILINTFYTYSFFDPEICEIKNGQPEVTRPDIHEEKLRVVEEMIGYLYYFREQEGTPDHYPD